MPKTDQDAASNDVLAADAGNDLIVASTPVPRDETAFSFDPFTGAVAHGSQALHRSSTEAMVALDAGHIDEPTYNRVVAGELALADVLPTSSSGDQGSEEAAPESVANPDPAKLDGAATPPGASEAVKDLEG